MKMPLARIMALFALLLSWNCSCEAAPASVPPEVLVQTVWMHVNGQWEYPPTDEDIPSSADDRYASVTLLRFTETHEFNLMHCLIVDTGTNLAVSNGDGQMIFIGGWGVSEGGINLRFRLVYETLPPVGEGNYPGPEEAATALLVGKTLEFRGETFEPAVRLSSEEFERFIAPERGKLKSAQP